MSSFGAASRKGIYYHLKAHEVLASAANILKAQENSRPPASPGLWKAGSSPQAELKPITTEEKYKHHEIPAVLHKPDRRDLQKTNSPILSFFVLGNTAILSQEMIPEICLLLLFLMGS